MDKTPFLATSEVVNFHAADIAKLAVDLRGNSDVDTAKNCFEWVRDNIEHSVDFKREETPYIASDVLTVGSGFCTAKSHLLVALLRANTIPAGFCYQRLTFDGPNPPYCLHGFIAVWLEDYGWYRCDARGNSKAGIHCEFNLGHETLAYPIQYQGECTYPEVWAEPWPKLLQANRELKTVSDYLKKPIDIEPPMDELTQYRITLQMT
ncbi:MAG: transglutaminase family protein [Gallionellaceae bacterium]